MHHDEAVGEGHRLLLVVRHVHDRRLEAAVQHAQLCAGLDAQARVEVRERLVEEEDLGIARDRAADRDALALAAGKLARVAVKQGVEPECLRDLRDARADRRGFLAARASRARERRDQRAAVRAPRLEAEGDVLANGEVRVERVVLEHERDVAILRGHVVHARAIDGEVAFADLLEARDHAQRGALAAARGADEHAELAVLDREIDGVNRAERAAVLAFVDLADLGERHIRHRGYLSPSPRRARDLRRRSSAPR